ncbi:MAG TPA: hypothetical protein VFF43_08425 [Caldimonas sp.]|nr:hypothetical protein [Caldimonas sp.]
MLDTLWSDWAEVRVLLAIGSATGADPIFTLDDPTYGQLDYGALGSPLAPYIDVTCDVRSLDWQFGATRTDGVLTRWEAGSAVVVLGNNEGTYDVGTDGATLRPTIGVLIQARNVGDTAWQPMFTGNANAFVQAYDPATLDCTVTVTATDGTALLASYQAQPVAPLVGAGETSAARVGRILDNAEWSAARDIPAGGRALAATDLSGDAWSQLLAVSDAELGAVYIAPSGAATFRTRETVFNALTSGAAPVVSWGPSATRYEDVTIAVDDALLRNIIDAQRPGGAVQSVRDTASVQQYLPHRYSNTTLVLAADVDVQSWASLVLNTLGVPFARVDALTVLPRADAAHLFPIVIAAAYLDRWHVEVDPPGPLSESIERDVIVRGWKISVDREDWTAVYQLSSTNAFTPFVLDDPDTQLDVARLVS